MNTAKDTLTLTLCDVTGRLFELSVNKGLDSEDFIQKYMNSDVCAHFDMPFDHTQWAGEEYVLSALLDEIPVKKGEAYWGEAMYWIGFTYRQWHLLTGESSKDIYKQADGKLMNLVYPAYHTLDVAMAIQRIKEAKNH